MNKMMRHSQWTNDDARQDPLGQLVDRLFEGSLFRAGSSDESSVVTSQWIPRVDIKEEADRFILYADIPGVEVDDIEVQMDKGMLTIKGERRSESSSETERFSRIERRYGAFHRRFALPDSANPDEISAQGDNGVLEITIPKRPETTPRRIEIGKRNNNNQTQQ